MNIGPATFTLPNPVPAHVNPACPTPVASAEHEIASADPSPFCSSSDVTMIVEESAIRKASPDVAATVTELISSSAPAPTMNAMPTMALRAASMALGGPYLFNK